jgi:hypothetical protein
MKDNIIDLDARRDKTIIIEQGDQTTTYLSRAYGSALLMKVHADGEVESICLGGDAMDKLCKTWMEYRRGKKVEA